MFLYYWYLRLLYGEEAMKKAEKNLSSSKRRRR